MNEKEKKEWKDDKCWWEVDERRKDKKNCLKKLLKTEEDSDTMMIEIVDVKNLNAEICMKYYIDDTTTILNNFTKFFFEFENFLRKENAMQMHEKK